MIRQRLTGLVATLGILALLIGLPWLLLQVGFGVLPSISSWSDLVGLLLRRDDGSLALVVIKAIGWVTWALLAGMILLEIAAGLRGVRAPDLRGFTLPQTAARQLVAAAAALFVALPANTVPAHADPTPAPAVVAAVTVEKPDVATPALVEVASRTRPHTVMRGESLWSIAEQHLGDGRRYTEIAALNSRLLDGKGDGFLKPGWTLHLPLDEQTVAVSATAPVTSYTVRKGDTLSQIALDHYGDARAYPRIANASRHIAQPDGRHLTNPDVIDIGWTLTIPQTSTHDAKRRSEEGVAEQSTPSTTAAEPVAPPHETEQPAGHAEAPAPMPPASAPEPAQVTPSASAQKPVDQMTTSSPQSESPGIEPAWLLSGLAGGTILAGSLWLALRRRRAAQFRSRRPGRMIAIPPPELAPVEKTITSVGAAAAPDVEFIDGALRRLAARQGRASQPMPCVAAVECSNTYLRLYLAEPADLPTPWEQAPDQLRWQLPTSIDLEDVGPLDPALPAPYPQLVTIGTDDHGDQWLYNLEEAGVLQVTGDPDYARDFVRHTAAELAVNAWARDVRVEGVGLAAEAVALNPRRVRHHDTADISATVIADTVAMIDRTHEAALDIATGRATLLDDPLWDSRILLVDGTLQTDLTAQLAGLLNDHPRQTGTSLLVLAERTAALPDDGMEVIQLTNTGRLQLSGVGISLIAAGLTAGEANGIASIFGQADQPDVQMPDHDEDADGWRAHANQAGQLNPEHTLPRDTPIAEDAVSVLPEDDQAYVDVAATTPADLAALAPQVPEAVRERVEHADPTLDDDLRTWFDPHCDLPRLMMLGPLAVRVAATGTPTAAAARKPFLTEMLAYLTTRPHGATTEEVADALRMPIDRVRKDAGSLRSWLGVNPRTGRSHLPDSRQTDAARVRGRGAYQVEGILVDADLFRRLRVRGEARGPAGLDDLKRALTLVTGTPFGQLRRDGGAWLADTGRLDQVLQCAIIDVAHLVTSACLAEGDLTGAHAAADLAAKVAPSEETAQLDLIAVLAAQGHHQVAEQMLRDRVCNRSDDEDEIPTELPARSEEIIDNHAWLARRNAKASA